MSAKTYTLDDLNRDGHAALGVTIVTLMSNPATAQASMADAVEAFMRTLQNRVDHGDLCYIKREARA